MTIIVFPKTALMTRSVFMLVLFVVVNVLVRSSLVPRHCVTIYFRTIRRALLAIDVGLFQEGVAYGALLELIAATVLLLLVISRKLLLPLVIDLAFGRHFCHAERLKKLNLLLLLIGPVPILFKDFVAISCLLIC